MDPGRLVQYHEKLNHFQDVCRAAGLKLTNQRLEVYRELVLATDHPSAEVIHRRVQERIPMIAVDTVYRTIATFESMGLLHRVQAFDDIGRFDADLSPHHHFVCHRCRAIYDFTWSAFEDTPPPAPAIGLGRVESRQIVFRGVCRRCLDGGEVPE